MRLTTVLLGVTRALADVKARCSAPPPLRGADGLDAGSAHARPGSCLTMTNSPTPESEATSRPEITVRSLDIGSASRSGIRDNLVLEQHPSDAQGERDATQEYLESGPEAPVVRLPDDAAGGAPAAEHRGPDTSPRRDPREVLAMPAAGPRATTRRRSGASTSCPCGTSPWSSSTPCAACPARAAACGSRPCRGPPASTD